MRRQGMVAQMCPRHKGNLGGVQEEMPPSVPFDHPAPPNRSHGNIRDCNRECRGAWLQKPRPPSFENHQAFGPISVYFSPNYTETQSGLLLTLAVLAVALVIGKAFAFEFGSVLAGR